VTRYLWVASRRAEGFPTTAACDVAGVSRQAFYDWSARRAAGPCPAELAEAELVGAIKQIHAASGGAYGSPRVTAQPQQLGDIAPPGSFSTPTAAPNTSLGNTPQRWPATRCANPSDGWATAGTTASPSRSSPPSSENSSPRPASRPETRPAARSSPGSAATTPKESTRPSTT